MKIITFHGSITNIRNQEFKDLVEINNVKEILLIPLSVYTISIQYRLKNKEYHLTDWDNHDIPAFYHIEIKEEN